MRDPSNPVCRTISTLLSRIGDKWTVLVVTTLGEGPRRFNELRREIPSVSQRMLTLTLRNLERDGLVSRTVTPSIPPRVDYALTEMGRRCSSRSTRSPNGRSPTSKRSTPPSRASMMSGCEGGGGVTARVIPALSRDPALTLAAVFAFSICRHSGGPLLLQLLRGTTSGCSDPTCSLLRPR